MRWRRGLITTKKTGGILLSLVNSSVMCYVARSFRTRFRRQSHFCTGTHHNLHLIQILTHLQSLSQNPFRCWMQIKFSMSNSTAAAGDRSKYYGMYVASITCTAPSHPSFSSFLHFLFLSPCPPRLMFAAVDFLFLLSLPLLLLLRRRLNTNPETASKPDPARIRTTHRYRLAHVAALIVAGSYAYSSYRAFRTFDSASGWKKAELTFLLAHFLAFAAVLLLVLNERRAAAAVHPPELRAYWPASFVFTTLLFIGSVVRFCQHRPLVPDDIIALASFPSSVVLLYLAVNGATGVSVAGGGLGRVGP